MTFRHTDADDKTRDNRAEDLSFRVYGNPTDLLTLGGGLGFTQVRDRHTSLLSRRVISGSTPSYLEAKWAVTYIGKFSVIRLN